MKDSPAPDGTDEARVRPAWMLFLAGWLFATTTLDEVRARVPRARPGDPAPIDLETSPARELRQLPGIGPSRAQAIVRARWERSGDAFDLREIPGIGPVIEARVLEALEQAAHGQAWGSAVTHRGPEGPPSGAGPRAGGE